ncbi:hypothetical protein AVENLUH5627_02468 [Acinetobacter venetianus]|uniref:Uncharacterized protein n=1 Tax=Acinetobacter venetianus TaxID=52133 RepID=A0A150HMJ2_9GAMM|nr:hypothetical protein AVENLUH5627_02468 [Acinetobacter venetianus]
MNLTIEKMREIVDAAPEWAVCWNAHMGIYTNGFIRCSSDISLNNLRISIADHDRTDNVSDIRNHVAPTKIVTDLHVNEALKLNGLG